MGNLFHNVDELPYSTMQQQVERCLRSINTLPTLPEIVMRIMRMVNDPKTTPAQLERVLCTDPAIVMKLLQVCVHRCSPVPAAAPRNGLCRRSSPASV
ncbi:MAG: HDOD domain-containing protein [Candidatus Latescibacterota bacterium]|nr:HDOD domain-containing protein [Candidatus Latescibacterota bacterium]